MRFRSTCSPIVRSRDFCRPRVRERARALRPARADARACDHCGSEGRRIARSGGMDGVAAISWSAVMVQPIPPLGWRPSTPARSRPSQGKRVACPVRGRLRVCPMRSAVRKTLSRPSRSLQRFPTCGGVLPPSGERLMPWRVASSIRPTVLFSNPGCCVGSARSSSPPRSAATDTCRAGDGRTAAGTID